MNGYRFSKHIAEADSRTPFERLLKVFMELLVYTSGDVEEAFDWLKELDREYNITGDDYSIEDFRRELEEKGYLTPSADGQTGLSAKSEKLIRKNAMKEIFGRLNRSPAGHHRTAFLGKGDEQTPSKRPFQFGDSYESIDFMASMRNAQINHGIEQFTMTENDLEVVEHEHKSQMSTVLMIDISHSMILYGEDRITPAKKVAMALAELIITKFPKDTLDIVVFGNDAWEVSIRDLPYLQVGPYHTNTVAGLQLAMDLLRKKKVQNKQIFMITDGKPTCIKVEGEYYQNSFGHDPLIINKTVNLAIQCRKLRIPVTTFMIARDPYLQEFVKEFTEANGGKAFYSSLDGLGDFIFNDYQQNKRRNSG